MIEINLEKSPAIYNLIVSSESINIEDLDQYHAIAQHTSIKSILIA